MYMPRSNSRSIVTLHDASDFRELASLDIPSHVGEIVLARDGSWFGYVTEMPSEEVMPHYLTGRAVDYQLEVFSVVTKSRLFNLKMQNMARLHVSMDSKLILVQTSVGYHVNVFAFFFCNFPYFMFFVVPRFKQCVCSFGGAWKGGVPR
jgi:hypothetical protein